MPKVYESIFKNDCPLPGKPGLVFLQNFKILTLPREGPILEEFRLAT
jgi:hypothetical protein